MTFEMSEIDHEIIIGKMVANYVIFDMRGVGYGNLHLSELVHKINFGNLVEAVVSDGLPMLCRILSCPAVCSATLHDSAIYLFTSLPIKSGLR